MKKINTNLCYILLLLIIGSIIANKDAVVDSIISTFMDKSAKELFKTYHLLFEKSKEYEINSEEGIKRYVIFKENVKKIKTHNARKLTWTEGINQFTDLTSDEFKQRFLMSENEIEQEIKHFKKFSLDDYDETQDEKIKDDPDRNNASNNVGALPNIDHRQYLKAVRNQGSCGSCYAFACAAATEANFSKYMGLAPFYLSTQQIVDCSTSTSKCNGGSASGGFSYIQNKGGLVEESVYPYKGSYSGSCLPINVLSNKYKISGYKSYVATSYSTIDGWHELLTDGPMYIRTDGYSLQNYRGGIITFSLLTTKKCNTTNHAVTATGFGYDKIGAYILARNSWGTKWGESGYFRAYYEKLEKDTCYLTRYGYRPIPSA